MSTWVLFGLFFLAGFVVGIIFCFTLFICTVNEWLDNWFK